MRRDRQAVRHAAKLARRAVRRAEDEAWERHKAAVAAAVAAMEARCTPAPGAPLVCGTPAEWVEPPLFARGTNAPEMHYGVRYGDGECVDPQPWQQVQGMCHSGIHFAKGQHHVLTWLLSDYRSDVWVREVTVLDGVPSEYLEANHKGRTHAVVLGPRMPVARWLALWIAWTESQQPMPEWRDRWHVDTLDRLFKVSQYKSPHLALDIVRALSSQRSNHRYAIAVDNLLAALDAAPATERKKVACRIKCSSVLIHDARLHRLADEQLATAEAAVLTLEEESVAPTPIVQQTACRRVPRLSTEQLAWAAWAAWAAVAIVLALVAVAVRCVGLGRWARA